MGLRHGAREAISPTASRMRWGTLRLCAADVVAFPFGAVVRLLAATADPNRIVIADAAFPNPVGREDGDVRKARRSYYRAIRRRLGRDVGGATVGGRGVDVVDEGGVAYLAIAMVARWLCLAGFGFGS